MKLTFLLITITCAHAIVDFGEYPGLDPLAPAVKQMVRLENRKNFISIKKGEQPRGVSNNAQLDTSSKYSVKS